MSSAYENAMSDQQANNYTQQYPVSKLCAHILCANGALFGGYCSDHQYERAESAEARAAELLRRLEDAQAYAGKLEAQVAGAASVVVLVTKERDEALRTIEAQAQKLDELCKAYDRMRDTVMDLTP